MGNELIYDTVALYKQHMNDEAQERFIRFYEDCFSGFKLSSIHDCSIGAGGATLPLATMGYEVSGSDLSRNLLNHAVQNFSEKGFSPNLFLADFRDIGEHLDKKVDCIISTGNSLPHVDMAGIEAFLQSASTVLHENGLLFFDLRNWDALVAESPVFHATDPLIMTAEEHKSLYLLFNWHDNGSVTFSFATSIDKNAKHVSVDIIKCPPYYPLLRRDIVPMLQKHGYELIKYFDMDEVHNLWTKHNKGKTGDFEQDFDTMQWYGVLAKVRS
jgi:cyclopropane fatty-acyl-phospholipid synthase-like methyltransferase